MITSGARNIVIKYAAISWLSFLLLMGNTPMEFIHLFADHNDTVHEVHKGLVIEKKHKHCAFLSLTIDAFINDYRLPVITTIFPEYFATSIRFSARYLFRAIYNNYLRGPPFSLSLL